MARRLLGPLRLDRRRHPRPQPVRLDDLGGHHPLWKLLGDRRPTHDRELRPSCPSVLERQPVTHPDLGEQPRQQRLMHTIRVAGLGSRPHTDTPGDPAQLAVQVLPLTHAQIVQELVATQLAELASRQCPLLFPKMVPERHQGEKVGSATSKPRVHLVGRLLLVDRPFTRILDRQR